MGTAGIISLFIQQVAIIVPETKDGVGGQFGVKADGRIQGPFICQDV